MTIDTTHKINVRLFVGCHISSEIRMHLNYSIQWKHATLQTSSPERIQEVHFHGKDYFGIFFEHKTLLINDLKKIQAKIKDELKIYCPDLAVENLKVCIFPQVFIA